MQLCSQSLDCDIQRLWCVRDLGHMHESLGSGVQGGGEVNYTRARVVEGQRSTLHNVQVGNMTAYFSKLTFFVTICLH